MTPDTGIAEVEVSAYEIPTAVPESDGTADWKSTGLVVVELAAGELGGQRPEGLEKVTPFHRVGIFAPLVRFSCRATPQSPTTQRRRPGPR